MAGTSHKPPNLAPELSKETFHGESVLSGRDRPSRPIPRALEDRKRCLGLNYPAVRRPAPDIPAGMSESGGRREQRPSAGWLSAGVTETAQTAADATRQQAVQFARDVGHELSTTGETQKARGVDAIRQFARRRRSGDGGHQQAKGAAFVPNRTLEQMREDIVGAKEHVR